MNINGRNLADAVARAESIIYGPFESEPAGVWRCKEIQEDGRTVEWVVGLSERTAKAGVAMRRTVAAARMVVPLDPASTLRLAQEVEKNLDRNTDPYLRLVAALSAAKIRLS